MALTTTPTPKKPEEDELVSSFFQQPQNAPAPATASPYAQAKTTAPVQRTPPAGRQQLPTTAAPKGNLDFSTLVGGAGTANAQQTPQRTTAPPLQDASAPPAAQTPPDPFQAMGGGYWTGQQWVPRDHPLATQGGGTGAPGAGGAPNPRPAWMTSQPYTPGEVGTDDLQFSYQDLLNQMGPDYQPTPVSGSNYEGQDVSPEDYATYDFGGFSGLPGMDVGAVGEDTDALIRRILANPESLDPRTVDMMKAASREEQSALQGQEADELRAMGYDLGVDDSAWLRSEQLTSRRNRDAAVTAGNRTVDIEAAKTNAGDRRAAAALGSSYVDSKGRLQLAQRGQAFTEQQAGESNKQASTASKQARAEYLTGVKSANADRALETAKLRTQADVANNQNMFNAAKLRQDKVLGTVDADLKRAAAATDRMALREQAAQAAAELGISQDKVMSDWLQSLMADATQRYGIDIAASVDREKLAQAGSEFKEDIAFRIMALDKELSYKYATLGESGRQFDLGYGLDAAGVQLKADEQAQNSYFRSQGM